MRQILTFFASGQPNRAGRNKHVASLLAAAFLIGSGASSAFSGELKQTAAAPKPVVNCTCRYRGTDYHLGDAVCLNGPSGPRMATCGMVLNNTSWSFSKTPCPTASLTPLPMPARQISWKG